jgi:hypothetical protein
VMRIADINRAVSRHRRMTAIAGTLVILGVVALDAHAALPEHHDKPGDATVCIAELAIATLAAFSLFKRQPASNTPAHTGGAALPRATKRFTSDTPKDRSRAGPSGLAVLRL